MATVPRAMLVPDSPKMAMIPAVILGSMLRYDRRETKDGRSGNVPEADTEGYGVYGLWSSYCEDSRRGKKLEQTGIPMELRCQNQTEKGRDPYIRVSLLTSSSIRNNTTSCSTIGNRVAPIIHVTTWWPAAHPAAPG